MRLIDADKLMEYCQNLKERKIDCNDIARFPTAYDVDEVVKQLEENSVMRANSKTFYNNPQNGKYVDEVVLLNKAIEIVKDGVKK